MALNPLPVQSADRLLGPPPVHCFRITGHTEISGQFPVG
jgi:hypothetical protein